MQLKLPSCARIAALAMLVAGILLAFERQAHAATVNSDVALTGTFGSLSGTGAVTITSITANFKQWLPFFHVDVPLSAGPQTRNLVVSSPGISGAIAEGTANFDYEDAVPGTPSFLHSLNVDLNGAGANNKNIPVSASNSASALSLDLGLLGTAGLILTLNANITDLKLASTGGATATPNYLIPGKYTFTYAGTVSARLVNVPLIGNVNRGTVMTLSPDTLDKPEPLPGTVALSDLDGGAPPFPNDMLVRLAAEFSDSTTLPVVIPIDYFETHNIPAGESGFSSFRVQGRINASLNLTTAYRLEGTVQDALAPEPSTFALAALGMIGFLAHSRRARLALVRVSIWGRPRQG